LSQQKEDKKALQGQIKCPICGNKMGEMGIRKTTDLTMSTLNYSESDKGRQGKRKHFVRTAVFVCDNCRNIQSFLLTNPKEAANK
jgi:hypothetical protein